MGGCRAASPDRAASRGRRGVGGCCGAPARLQPAGREPATGNTGASPRVTASRAGARRPGVMLARAQGADADLRELQDGVCGTLRLGVFPSVGARMVPPLLLRLAE